MLKKTITYTDYNGTERIETFYFNLTKAEIMEMELGTSGGMAEQIQRIVDAQDGPEIMRIFKELIMKSYGVKTPDGRRIVKTQEFADEFVQTEAYSELFMELITNADSASKFVNGIIPGDIAQQAMADKPYKGLQGFNGHTAKSNHVVKGVRGAVGIPVDEPGV